MDETKKTAKVSRFEWAWCVAFAVLAAVVLGLLGNILRPAHTAYGSTWDAFLAEPKDSIDVLFLGSSYAYCDWNPGVMYGESGLTGYVMGGSEQTVGITYYYLKEALKTQTPSVVMMEGTGLFFQPYQSYTQINVGYMPWGRSKLGAIREFSEPELRTGLLFDLCFYHDRWKELTAADLKKALPVRRADDFKGYTPVEGVFVSETGVPAVSGAIRSEEDYLANLKTFERIAALCREEGIDLVVTMNPTYGQFSPEIYSRLEQDVLAAGAGRFVNWADAFEEIGLDAALHLYDGGHLNQAGAAIFSRFTGQYLRSLGYEPRVQSEENAAAWEGAAAFWQEAE